MILTISLGVGANTAIFSLIDAVILRTLPVKNPERLVFLEAVSRGGTDGGFPLALYEQIRNGNKSLAGVVAFDGTRVSARIDGQPTFSGGSVFPVTSSISSA